VILEVVIALTAAGAAVAAGFMHTFPPGEDSAPAAIAGGSTRTRQTGA
jgi:hypothetical protein